MVYTHISNKPEKVAQARLTVGALVLAPYEEKYYRAKILGTHVPYTCTCTCMLVYIYMLYRVCRH